MTKIYKHFFFATLLCSLGIVSIASNAAEVYFGEVLNHKLQTVELNTQQNKSSIFNRIQFELDGNCEILIFSEDEHEDKVIKNKFLNFSSYWDLTKYYFENQHNNLNPAFQGFWFNQFCTTLYIKFQVFII